MNKVPLFLRSVIAALLLLSGGLAPASAGVDVGGLIGGFGGIMQGAIQADQQRQYMLQQQQIQRQQQLLYEQQLRYQQQQLDRQRQQQEQAPPAAVWQEQQARAPSYTIDGHALGQILAPETLPADFRCHPSEQFSGFQWCRSRTLINDVWTSSSLILSPANAIVYNSKFFEAANFQPGAVASEINRLSTLHRQQAALVRMPGPAADGGGVIATWGALTLQPIDAATVNTLAAGGSVTAGVMVDFLNDIRESAKRGLPIYRLAGGAGYYWIARYDRKGQGKLRYGVADAQAFDLPKPPPAPPPAPAVAAVQPVQPVVAPPPPSTPTQTLTASTPAAPVVATPVATITTTVVEPAASDPAPDRPAKAPLPDIPKQGRRIALVIGNSAYRDVPVLENPKRDAEAVAEALKSAGFDSVSLVTDATWSDMIKALRDFEDQAPQADWAMVYFAGHGIEVDGHEYLVPIDAKLVSTRDAEDETVSLDNVMHRMLRARKLRLVILDACREDPFQVRMASGDPNTRGINRGLRRLQPNAAPDEMIFYSAGEGEFAKDGESDGHSPFAKALIARLAMPRVEVDKLFKYVTNDVEVATDNDQHPYVYGSTPGVEDYYFRAQ